MAAELHLETKFEPEERDELLGARNARRLSCLGLLQADEFHELEAKFAGQEQFEQQLSLDESDLLQLASNQASRFCWPDGGEEFGPAACSVSAAAEEQQQQQQVFFQDCAPAARRAESDWLSTLCFEAQGRASAAAAAVAAAAQLMAANNWPAQQQQQQQQQQLQATQRK